MAVQPQTPYKEYTANGATTVFPLEFDCENKDHLIVMLDDAEVDNSTWSLTDEQVIFNVAPAVDKKITLQRNTPYRRDRNYQAYDNSFRPGPVNDDFDWIWWKLQELGVADWILGARLDALKNYVDRKDDELKAYLMEEIRKQGVALDQLDAYYNYLMERLAQIAVDKGWDATFVVDGDKNQHQINEETQISFTLQKLHNKSSATFTDYLTASEIANRSTIDLSAKLQSINDAGDISTLRVTNGTYYINDVVTFNRDFTFDMDSDAVFKLGESGSIKFEGSATLIGKPTANIINNSKTISIPNTLSPYDLVCIYNPTDYSFSPHRANYKAGEFLKVASATPTSFFIFGRTYADYIATDVDIYKINSIKISFNRFNVDATNSLATTPVKFTFCEDLNASSFFNRNSKSAGVTLDRCYNTNFGDPVGTNTQELIGTNYGVVISNCQYMRVSGSGSMAVRHCMTSGGDNVICSVPCRELIISDSTFKGGSTTGITSADFHGNTEQSMYKDCVIEGLSIGGKNNTVKGCTIIGRPTDSLAISVGEIVGGYFDFIDCNIVANSNIANSFGAITIAIDNDKDLLEDLTINFKNLKINGKSTAAYNLIRVVTSVNNVISKKITINIDGFDCKLTNHGSILYVQGGASQPILPNVEVNMHNIKTIKKGVAYVTVTSTILAETTKLNLPRQRGSQLIAVPPSNISGNVAGVPITLDYSYPYAPSVLHSVGTDGTWSIDSSFNLKPVHSMLSINSLTQIRFSLVSPSALPEKIFKVSFDVGI
ncbi:hypothetical protein [Acinetobacter sp. YH1901134]|uniref:phage tailspike polysaccharide lyase family protein n=1 Tax=Acinetobacter sp. YH1901134 TaxID=2601199 RepID=UPI0015D450FC|nr:hypothetical protein [Acinetobacter sp. YH1901134]